MKMCTGGFVCLFVTLKGQIERQGHLEQQLLVEPLKQMPPNLVGW